MEYPEVTVFVTLRNAVHTIENCHKSIMDLNYPKDKMRVLYIDAFSTDGSWEKLKEISKDDKRIVLLQVKGGPATAYNHALKNSIIKTPLFALTDADCVVDKSWLKEIVKPMEDPKVVGVAGVAINPEGLGRLPKLIGMELTKRYARFPNRLPREATMNLCVRTEVAKEILFDERLFVSYDTDFGYRTTSKYGLFVYNKDAKVYHYHRASWKSFFRQQFLYARYVPMLYLKHFHRATGDHVSTPGMMIQPFILGFAILSLLISGLVPFFYYVFAISITLLMVLYTKTIWAIETNSFIEIFYLFGIMLTRNVAWLFGLFMGILDLIKGKYR